MKSMLPSGPWINKVVNPHAPVVDAVFAVKKPVVGQIGREGGSKVTTYDNLLLYGFAPLVIGHRRDRAYPDPESVPLRASSNALAIGTHEPACSE